MASLRIPVTTADHHEGPADAPVTLVEYGDYECPHCGRAFPIVKALQKTLKGKLRFVFRNFPISQIHPHAEHAAIAAEAAGRQGKFWPMHDRIFLNQAHLDDASLRRLAGDLKLDLEQFDRDVRDPALAARVQADFNGGVRSGVNGTPTFYVNGVRVDTGFSYDELLAALEEALEATK
jgi:protein-disulfide isomerase